MSDKKKRFTDKKKAFVMEATIKMIAEGNVSMTGKMMDFILEEEKVSKVNAESSKEILTSLSKGMITATEAKELMQMLQTKTEIDLAPKILKQMKKLNDNK